MKAACVIACLALCAPRLAVAQYTLNLAELGEDLPISGSATLSPPLMQDQRLGFALDVETPDLWAELDAAAIALGNLSGGALEFYWLGPTQYVASDGASVTLRSRGRIQTTVSAQVFGQTLERKLSDTRSLVFQLTPAWQDGTKQLMLTAQVLEIDDIPTWAQGVVDYLSAPLAQELPLFAASEGRLKDLDVQVQNLNVRGHDLGASFGADISADARAGFFPTLNILLGR